MNMLFKQYILLVFLIIVEILILTVWSIKDPLVKKTTVLSTEFVDKNNNHADEMIKTYHIETCKSNNMLLWIGIRKCLLMAVKNLIFFF